MVIAIATVVAGYQEVMVMVSKAKLTLADLLLMFLYLEVLTMVGLYYNSGKLPVRFPLYIAMVALARYVILDVKELDFWHLIGIATSILLIAGADGKAAIAAGVTDDLVDRISAVDLVRVAAEAMGGKGGGGRPDMAQAGGADARKADEAITAAKAVLEG